MHKKVLTIAGATASGKSALAIKLAKDFKGEIISGDSIQVYRGLDIGSGKIKKEEMEGVAHHLIDIKGPKESYSVYDFQKMGRLLIDAIEMRGHLPIICGGTGLYIRAGLYDYRFPSLRKVDLSAYEKLDDEKLFAAALSLDEAEAKTIHPHNRVRLLRLIAMALAGEKKSEIKQSQSHQPIYDVRFYGLEVDREDIYPRVEQRVERMFEMGLVEEDRRLVEKYGRDCQAFKAIGVKELFPYFDGKISLEEAKADIKKNTRHYVKRQETFFRHQFPINWIKTEEDILNDLSGLV